MMEPMIQIPTSDTSKRKRSVSGIKVRRNSIVSPKNNKLRNREVKITDQGSVEMEKEKKVRTQRWMAESMFSSIKRMFGEYTLATRFQNMVKEMMIKVSLYNLFRRI